MRWFCCWREVLAPATGAVAWAGIPDSGGPVHACALNATNTIRLIDTAKPNDLIEICVSVESELT